MGEIGMGMMGGGGFEGVRDDLQGPFVLLFPKRGVICVPLVVCMIYLYLLS